MPFDNMPVTYPELRAFRDLLRDPASWPEEFRWDFSKCRTCAMGLLGVVEPDGWGTGWEPFYASAERLAISHAWADWLFSSLPAIRRGIRAGDVTAGMVADDIDHLLVSGL